MEDAADGRHGNAGWPKESSPETKVMGVFRTVVNRSVSKSLHNSAFEIQWDELLNNAWLSHKSPNYVLSCTNYFPILTAVVVKLVLNNVISAHMHGSNCITTESYKIR